MPQNLNERTVKAIAPPKTGAITVWDSETTGFGVRVFAPTNRRPRGARSFFMNYRVDGRERRYTIGSFPEWSAEAARKEAKELRRRIDRGEDPAGDKRERREAPTVADLADRYRTVHLPKKAESSQANDWQMIKNEILPDLGSRKVADVHHGDIEALRARGARFDRFQPLAKSGFRTKNRSGYFDPWGSIAALAFGAKGPLSNAAGPGHLIFGDIPKQKRMNVCHSSPSICAELRGRWRHESGRVIRNIYEIRAVAYFRRRQH
jgi:hypothetical protein